MSKEIKINFKLPPDPEICLYCIHVGIIADHKPTSQEMFEREGRYICALEKQRGRAVDEYNEVCKLFEKLDYNPWIFKPILGAKDV